MMSSSEVTRVEKLLDGEQACSSDEGEEDPHSAFFTINIANQSNFDLEPEGQTSSPIKSAPLDDCFNPECIPGTTSPAELSAADSAIDFSSTRTDSISLSESVSSFSVAGYLPIQSTSTSSSSTPASFRRPIGRSASDSNFKAHVGAFHAGVPIHTQLDPIRFTQGRSNNLFETSDDVFFKKGEWLEEGYIEPEVDAFEVRESSSLSDESFLRQQHDHMHSQEAAFQRQSIANSTQRPSWGSLFKTFPLAERSLLCSHCKQMSPVLRNIPRRFSYRELEGATNNFSEANFLAEGGFGFVYQGELNGQAIAVKQHKLASTQGYKEFR